MGGEKKLKIVKWTAGLDHSVMGKAERFIMLTIREPMDYTKWRERNMYLDGDLDALAERARRVGAKFEAERQTRQSATAVAV